MNFKAKFFDELTTTELYEILKARELVFLLEQNIVCQDMDDVDYKSLHCFIEHNNSIIAYLRAFHIDNDTVKIGRVLTITRGVGIGKKLIEYSISVIKEKFKYKIIKLNSQSYAVGFYEKCGFKAVSDEFLEEGISHITMEYQVLRP